MAKVLIIEDEDLVARMYQSALNFDGHEAVTAIGGTEGVEKVKTEKPEIVLLDIMMPGMNGIEVLEAIRNDPETANLPVVMLTNMSGKNDVELAVSKGADDYWVKADIKTQELGKRIEEVIEKKNKLGQEEDKE
jgi:two-component system, OmpR family, alkaline phosphatase synthesis response regulator PhoP